MTNLHGFITALNSTQLHANARYAFDWPGVLSFGVKDAKQKRQSYALVQNVDVDPIDHTSIDMFIDGHAIPILGSPTIGHDITMTLLLEQDFMQATYANLLNMLYLSTDDYEPTTGGLSNDNYVGLESSSDRTPMHVAKTAKLYVLNPRYTNTDKDNLSQYLVFQYPRVKRVGSLSFDSTASDITRLQIVITAAWISHGHTHNDDESLTKFAF